MHSSQYPKPVASGGLAQTPGFRPLRGPPAASVRQPDLGGAPRVFGLNGFGTGGAAMVRGHGQDADQSAGLVAIWTGTTTPSASGLIQLSFPVGIVTNTSHWVAADWAVFGLNASGGTLFCNWTANRVLLPRELLTMAYQWAISQ